MLITDRPSADVDALRPRLHGEVHGPQDPHYDALRRPWNRAVDQRPAAVALPRTTQDVIALVHHARERGLRLATGDAVEDTILVRTDHLRGVRIDPHARTARVRAGARWRDVTGPAAQYGLAPLAGTAPGAGVVGHALTGGLGWLSRAHGWTCNSVKAIELVLADGTHVRTDHATHPELSWALRGGGASGFGIVTALELELYPAPALHGGALLFPGIRAGEVLAAWRDWTRTVPDEVSSIARILNPPGGDSVVRVEVATTGDAQVLQPLRELRPVADLIAPMTPDRLPEIHNDPSEPTALVHAERLLEDGTLAGLVSHAGAPLLTVELRHLGGALARGSVSHGAVNRVHAPLQLHAAGVQHDAQSAMAVDAALTRLTDALEPWNVGGVHDAFTRHRLRALKERIDGAGLFAATGSSSTA